MSPSTFHILGRNIDRREWGLTDACEILHNRVTGAMSLAPDNALTIAFFLMKRVTYWETAPTKTKAYDAAIKQLCWVSLVEYMSTRMSEDLDAFFGPKTEDTNGS